MGAWTGGAVYLHFLVSPKISLRQEMPARAQMHYRWEQELARVSGGEREASQDRGLGEGRPVTGSQGWGGGVVVRDLVHQTLLFIFNGFSSRRSLDTTSPFAKRHVAPARTCWVAGDGIRGESDEFLFHGRCVWGDCQGTTGCLWRVCLGLAALK